MLTSFSVVDCMDMTKRLTAAVLSRIAVTLAATIVLKYGSLLLIALVLKCMGVPFFIIFVFGNAYFSKTTNERD